MNGARKWIKGRKKKVMNAKRKEREE